MNETIIKTVEILQQGGIILYPTDTIWGIGCDATNPEAVQKIYDLKQRSEAKSMLILVNGERMLYQVFNQVPEVAFQLWEFAVKPTTLILDNPKGIAKNLLAEDNSLGVRMVNEPFLYKVLERFKKPIVSTSANLSGDANPTCFNEINPILKQKIDFVVPLYHDKICKNPSTIIKLTADSQVKIIRK